MKKWFAALISSFGAAAHPATGVMDQNAFTSLMLQALQGKTSDHTVERLGPLHLKLEGPSGAKSDVFLSNAYSEYVRDPSSQTEVVDRYVASWLEVDQRNGGLDSAQIVPVIKDRHWLEEISLSIKRMDVKALPEQVFEPLNDELVIVYAEDTPSNVHYFTENDLHGAGLERAQLRSLSIKNLRRILPDISLHGGPLVSMLTAGGDYVSSLLLFDELWSGGQLEVDGSFVVAVPSRDVLLFTGSKNKDGVAKLRALATKARAESSYALTEKLFVYVNGNFVVFDD